MSLRRLRFRLGGEFREIPQQPVRAVEPFHRLRPATQVNQLAVGFQLHGRARIRNQIDEPDHIREAVGPEGQRNALGPGVHLGDPRGTAQTLDGDNRKQIVDLVG